MKVYVIQKGQYSDCHIVGVALTSEAANKIAKAVSGPYSYDKAFVEEYDTERFSTGLFRYCVTYDGYDWEAEYDEYNCYINATTGKLYGDTFVIDARSPEEAIKIAQDMAAEAKAKEAGIC